MSQSMNDFNIGDGVSYYINGDSYPGTVIDKKGQRIFVQSDTYHCVKKMSAYGADDAEFDYARNPEGDVSVWSLRKNARFRRVGSSNNSGFSLSLGRHYRQNPSF